MANNSIRHRRGRIPSSVTTASTSTIRMSRSNSKTSQTLSRTNATVAICLVLLTIDLVVYHPLEQLWSSSRTCSHRVLVEAVPVKSKSRNQYERLKAIWSLKSRAAEQQNQQQQLQQDETREEQGEALDKYDSNHGIEESDRREQLSMEKTKNTIIDHDEIASATTPGAAATADVGVDAVLGGVSRSIRGVASTRGGIVDGTVDQDRDLQHTYIDGLRGRKLRIVSDPSSSSSLPASRIERAPREVGPLLQRQDDDDKNIDSNNNDKADLALGLVHDGGSKKSKQPHEVEVDASLTGAGGTKNESIDGEDRTTILLRSLLLDPTTTTTTTTSAVDAKSKSIDKNVKVGERQPSKVKSIEDRGSKRVAKTTRGKLASHAFDSSKIVTPRRRRLEEDDADADDEKPKMKMNKQKKKDDEDEDDEASENDEEDDDEDGDDESESDGDDEDDKGDGDEDEENEGDEDDEDGEGDDEDDANADEDEKDGEENDGDNEVQENGEGGNAVADEEEAAGKEEGEENAVADQEEQNLDTEEKKDADQEIEAAAGGEDVTKDGEAEVKDSQEGTDKDVGNGEGEGNENDVIDGTGEGDKEDDEPAAGEQDQKDEDTIKAKGENEIDEPAAAEGDQKDGDITGAKGGDAEEEVKKDEEEVDQDTEGEVEEDADKGGDDQGEDANTEDSEGVMDDHDEVKDNDKPSKASGQEENYPNEQWWDDDESKNYGIVIVLILLVICVCCYRFRRSRAAGVPTVKPPQVSQYQGISTQDEDDGDWGWDDEDGGDFEMSTKRKDTDDFQERRQEEGFANLAQANGRSKTPPGHRIRLKQRGNSRDSGSSQTSVEEYGGSGHTPNTRPGMKIPSSSGHAPAAPGVVPQQLSSPPTVQPLSNLTKKTVAPAPVPSADDFFAEMGFSAAPSKVGTSATLAAQKRPTANTKWPQAATTPLGTTSASLFPKPGTTQPHHATNTLRAMPLPVDSMDADDWGDDEDLDDLLDD